MAVLVAVFVLEADFYPAPRPILVVRASAVAVPVGSVIGAGSPVATYRAVVRIHVGSHVVPHLPHIVLAQAIHPVAIALLRSPIATYLTVFTSIPVLLARLLRAALWLHGNGLGLAGSRRLPLILGECGNQT